MSQESRLTKIVGRPGLVERGLSLPPLKNPNPASALGGTSCGPSGFANPLPIILPLSPALRHQQTNACVQKIRFGSQAIASRKAHKSSLCHAIWASFGLLPRRWVWGDRKRLAWQRPAMQTRCGSCGRQRVPSTTSLARRTKSRWRRGRHDNRQLSASATASHTPATRDFVFKQVPWRETAEWCRWNFATAFITSACKKVTFSSLFVWPSICLIVSNFAHKLPIGFAWNFPGRLVMGHWTSD